MRRREENAICMPVKCGSLLRNLELLEIIPTNFRANEADAVTTTTATSATIIPTTTTTTTITVYSSKPNQHAHVNTNYVHSI